MSFFCGLHEPLHDPLHDFMKQPPATASGRLEYLDLIRGVFILVMIEGHTLRAFLSPEAKASLLYQRQELIHNLTGPAFLFASGAAFVYSSRSRWDEYRRWGPKLRGRVTRWLVVLIAGYALQLTYSTLWRTLAESTHDQFAHLLSLNILQCIVYSLFLLQALMRAAPSWQWFYRAAVILAVGIALLTPLAWNYGQHASLWVAPFLNGRTLSIFPLFSYTGFALAGAAWGHLHLLARDHEREAAFLGRCAGYAAGLCVAGVLLAYLPLPELFSDLWYSSPVAFMVRLGIIGLVTVVARWLEPRLLPRFRWLAVVGEQSLLIYVIHLLVLYGSAFNPDTSLLKTFGVPLDFGPAVLVVLAFGAAMVALAVWWDSWRKGHPQQARGVWWTVAGYYSFRFFLS